MYQDGTAENSLSFASKICYRVAQPSKVSEYKPLNSPAFQIPTSYKTNMYLHRHIRCKPTLGK